MTPKFLFSDKLLVAFIINIRIDPLIESGDMVKTVQESIEKAKVLIDALPFMQEFRQKTIVIKYGGHAMVDDHLKKQFALNVILLKQIGINPVIVHGGGPQINTLLDRLDIKPSYVEGMRVTGFHSAGKVCSPSRAPLRCCQLARP